ncbi:MAG TPA: hypothetical protein VIB49_11370 [Thermoplasmata archaeon]|jgi:hypothetical protein
MHTEPSWRQWARRFWSLGYSRVFLILAVILALVALALPIWAITEGSQGGGDWSTTTYGWTSRTRDNYEAGTLKSTTIEYYGGPGFPVPALASGSSASYAIIAVYVMLLIGVFVLFSTEWARTMPPLFLIIISIVVVLVALLALFYPVATIPSAAATSTPLPINGFWGSSTAPALAWGAGASWWLLLVAVVLGCFGAAFPYIKSIRGGPVVEPRAWHPGR